MDKKTFCFYKIEEQKIFKRTSDVILIFSQPYLSVKY